jgi:hypothetical protein
MLGNNQARVYIPKKYPYSYATSNSYRLGNKRMRAFHLQVEVSAFYATSHWFKKAGSQS